MHVKRLAVLSVLVTLAVTAALIAQDLRDTPGPLERSANPITPENPVPRRTYSVAPFYPAEAQAIDGSATVSLVATLDASGRVAEIRKVNTPLVMTPPGTPPNATALAQAADALVRSAVAALRQWQYDPPAKPPITFAVTFTFRPGSEPTMAQDTSGRSVFIAPPPPPPAPPAPGAVTSAPFADVQGAVRVGGAVRPPTQTKKVNPAYPAIAQSSRVQGVVILETLIGTDGRVRDVRVLRSIPLLDQAAIDAVRQWEYTPTLLNGAPVPIIMTTTVQFTLPEAPK